MHANWKLSLISPGLIQLPRVIGRLLRNRGEADK